MNEEKYSIDFMVEQGVPEHTAHSIQNYIVHKLEPGSFLKSVICDDLFGAFANADSINARALKEIVSYFYNYAPMNCWGSADVMIDWLGVE